MLVRVREKFDSGGRVTGYTVDTFTAEGGGEHRETEDLAQAFAWQAHVSRFGEFPADPIPTPELPAPDPVQEPEVVKAKKGRKK